MLQAVLIHARKRPDGRHPLCGSFNAAFQPARGVNRYTLAHIAEAYTVADPVAKTNPEGVDFGWVMQVTFVVTILVGAPLVAVLSTTVELSTWGARANFAIRVGAPIWLTTNVAAYLYAKYKREDTDDDDQPESAESTPADDE